MQQIPVEQLRERLPEFVARIHTETKVPGIAVAVSVGGERVYAQAGTRNVDDSLPLTTDDRFHLGCATKLLLAVVTLELARSGRLDLNATIAEYLPELENTLHGNTIRLAHLLSHTSGYRGTNILEPETRELTWDAFVEYLRHTPQFFAPGSVFNYEHTEAVLLGEIIRRATDKTTLTLIREMVFEPLGISPGLFETDARGAGRHDLDPTSGRFKRLDHVPPLTEFWLSAFSNYTLSLVDLVTIAESAIGVGLSRSSSTSPVSNATLNLLQRPVVWLPPTAGGPLRELLPVAFGLGAAQLRDGSHGNSGLTHGQCLGLRFDSRTGIAIAAGLNAMVPHLRDFILAAICRDLTGQSSAHERQRFGFNFEDLTGVYRGPGKGTVTAALDKERLICEIGREGSDQKLGVELVLDDDQALVLRSPAPQLSLGFFREPGSGDVGLMIGLSAYKRIAGPVI